MSVVKQVLDIRKQQQYIKPHQQRIKADGGSLVRDDRAKEFFDTLKSIGIYDSCLLAISPDFGIKTRVSGSNTFVSKGYSLKVPTPQYGPELITNAADREFTSDTGFWGTAVGNIVKNISGGTCTVTNPNSSDSGIYATGLSLVLGKKYRITYTLLSISASSFRVWAGFTLGAVRTVPGTYIEDLVVTTDGTLRMYSMNASTFSIDNISVVEVIYSLDGSPTDATQTTSTSQPHLGNIIAPNERPSFKNQNGQSNYLTHPTISFAANQAWTVSTVVNNDGKLGTAGIYSCGANTSLQCWYYGNFRIRFDNSLGSPYVFDKYLSNLIGKNTIITLSTKGDGSLSLYVNGVFIESIAAVTSIELSKVFFQTSSSFYGSIPLHTIFNRALTPTQVAQLSNYLTAKYPDIPTVKIGNDYWATSNCEMVATPQGNLIANVTANANVEKVVNGGFEGTFTNGLSQGWSNNGSTPTEEIGRTGGKAQGISRNTNDQIYQVPSGLTVGRYVKISFWYKVISGTGAYLQYYTTTPLNQSEWTYVSIFNIVVNTSTGLDFHSGGAGSKIIIDDVSVQEIGWAGSTELYNGICGQTAAAVGAVEKITNAADREFSSDTGFWSKSGGITIVGGVASFPPGNTKELIRNSILTVGKYYKITVSIVRYVAGHNLYVRVGDNNDIFIGNAVGTYTIYAKAVGTNIDFLSYAAGNFDIDNISVQELGVAGQEATYEYAAVKAAAMWCFYNNDADLGAIYGKLYNWYAVKLLQMDIDYYNAANPSTPWGYRVPTDTDFNNLATALGGASVAGGKMKVGGETYWNAPNTGADNSSGFSAIGVGYRNNIGVFTGSPSASYFTSITEYSAANSYSVYVIYNSDDLALNQSNTKIVGFPLRLLKS